VSKSVKFYYFYGDIYFVENTEVYYMWKDGVIRSSSCSPDVVDEYSEFIEEVFN